MKILVKEVERVSNRKVRLYLTSADRAIPIKYDTMLIINYPSDKPTLGLVGVMIELKGDYVYIGATQWAEVRGRKLKLVEQSY